jgi:hypothetical protein
MTLKLTSAKFFPSPLKFVRPAPSIDKKAIDPWQEFTTLRNNQWLPAWRARLPVNHFDTSVSMFLSACFI